jgi:hypothetical protein
MPTVMFGDVQVRADYGCGFTSDQMMFAAARLNITIGSAAATLSLTPWLNTTEGGAVEAVCGGKPASANFRYKVRGLVRGQTFRVLADAGPSCAVVTKPSE